MEVSVLIPDPEVVLEVAAQLREARERVASLEAKWAAFFTPTTQNSFPLELPPLKTRIVELLESDPTGAYSVATVTARLQANANSVGPYLSDLVGDGRIERRARGMYGALSAKHVEGGQEESLTAA
jgi:hypothetical protein